MSRRVLYVNTGSCNGCDIELLVAFTRLIEQGVDLDITHEVEHETYDILIVTGPVTAQHTCRFIRELSKIKKLHVKNLVLVGVCACDGGIWYDSYATLGGFESFVRYIRDVYNIEITYDRVYYISGCPPRPDEIFNVLYSSL